MPALQNVLRNLCNRGEIGKTEFDQVRPNNVKTSKGPWPPKNA